MLPSGPACDLWVTHFLVSGSSEGHMTPLCLCCLFELSSWELGAQGSTVWTNQYFGSRGELEQFLLSNITKGLRIGYWICRKLQSSSLIKKYVFCTTWEIPIWHIWQIIGILGIFPRKTVLWHLNTFRHLSKVSLLMEILSSTSQGANMAKQIGAATYIECSALQSENSVRDIFHVATLACVNKTNKNVKRNKSQRATKRISHMPSRPELSAVATDLRKDKAKSCTVMWSFAVCKEDAGI